MLVKSKVIVLHTLKYGESLIVNVLLDISGVRMMTAPDKQSNSWYTIDGRRLNGRPQQSGLYINAGRKVIIKI